MANNVIMFYSDLSNRNLQNLSADLCVYSNTIVNCTVSLTSTLDYSSFAPYDSVECVLINRPNVHSDTEYEYNYYSFMRIGTNPALMNIGVNSTNATAIATGPLFYISEIADIGGGMRKIKGVSALALLDTQHYGGAYWASNNRGNVVNEAIDLMQNWHQQCATNTIYSEGLTGTNVNDIEGVLNANTNRNALGQIFVAYSWHVGYNRNIISNATLWISRNPSNFCTYTVPTNRIYVGNNLSERPQSTGYRVNVTGYRWTSTGGGVNVCVLNNSYDSSTIPYIFSCTPVLTNSLMVLIGVYYYTEFKEYHGDSDSPFYSMNVRARNQWVSAGAVYRTDNMLDPSKINLGGKINVITSSCNGYNMPSFFLNITPEELTVNKAAMASYPFPLGDASVSWWELGNVRTGEPKPTEVILNLNTSLNKSTLIVLRANTILYEENSIETTVEGGLTITSYNISDIGIISQDNSVHGMGTVQNRILNFAKASGTEKLSFPWNGARPGDILNIDNNRNGFITDMTITLSNVPKATANVRINYYGK